MKLRCKPGDLAVVVNLVGQLHKRTIGSTLQHLYDAIIEVSE